MNELLNIMRMFHIDNIYLHYPEFEVYKRCVHSTPIFDSYLAVGRKASVDGIYTIVVPLMYIDKVN